MQARGAGDLELGGSRGGGKKAGFWILSECAARRISRPVGCKMTPGLLA